MLELMTIKTEAFRMTDTEFDRFCLDNPELRIERTVNKEIIIMSPSFPKTRIIINLINLKLGEWCHRTKSGYITDSSSGFVLPDGSFRYPDVAWIPMETWKNFSKSDRDGFLKYCPEFIIEVRSKTDRIKDLQTKMKNWIQNGAKLAWLIDPEEEKTWIYRDDSSIIEVGNFDQGLQGEDILSGFSLDLKSLRLE